jgi:enediyne biosynthesis protein E4
VLFEDAGKSSGAGVLGMPSVRWGTHFADFDNDGWPDLYAVGGHLAPRMVRALGHYRSGKAVYVDAGDRSFAQPPVLMHNLGEGHFVEWKDAGDFGRARMAARGSAAADFDGDGALDLVVVDVNGPVRFFRNTLPAGNWIAIEPRTGNDGKAVLETRVRVTANGRTQTQTFRVSPSYLSGSLVPLHFGLGAAEQVDEIEVRWPDGRTQTFRDVPGKKVYSLSRGGELASR